MTTIDLNSLELVEFISKVNPNQHCKATFPLLGAHGSRECATVYFEIQPGDHLGRHTDSAEELLLILEGVAEVSVGDETITAGDRGLVLVPKMVPHNLKNVGNRALKVIGFFGGANNIVATFDETWLPTESKVVDTAAATQG